MCNFLSAFIHRRADKLPLDKRYTFGDLRSHSESAQLAGIKYGAGPGGDDWAEFEWTGEDEDSLEVRDERANMLKAVILGDFANRAACVVFGLQRLPASLTTLYASGCTLPEGLKLPASLTTLDASGCTLPSGLVVPKKCRVNRYW